MLRLLIQLFSSFLCSLVFFNASAQAPPVKWVKTFGSTNHDMIWDSAEDQNGDIINVGVFRKSVDFDPGPDSLIKTAPGWTGNAFIQKMDAAGNFLWAKTVFSNKYVRANRVALAKNGSMVVTGHFQEDSVDLNPDPNQSYYIQGKPGTGGTFILKLSNQGKFIWAACHPGEVIIQNISLTNAGRIYLIANFDGTMDTYPSEAGSNFINPTTNGKSDVFIEKLDTAGQQIWFKTITGQQNIEAWGLDFTSTGDIVIGGSFEDTADFDPGPNTVMKININGDQRAYILRLDSAGTYQYVFTHEGTGRSEICDLSLDKNDNLYVCGWYLNNVDFDPSAASQTPVSSSHKGWFLQKLKLNGSMIWVHPYKTTALANDVRPVSLHLNANRLYLTGFYRDKLYLEPGTAGGQVLPDPWDIVDIFISLHDTSGVLQWAQYFPISMTGKARSVFENSSGDVLISGWFDGLAFFGPPVTTTPTPSAGGLDAFVLKIDRCPDSIPDTLYIVEACHVYQMQGGKSIYSDTLLVDTLQNTLGCDSIIEKRQIQINPPLGVTYLNGSLTWDYYSSPDASSYRLQWMDCNTQTLLPDTGYHFAPAQNGSYAVIVEKNSCIDTSECRLVDDVHISERQVPATLEIYPNPTRGHLHASMSHKEIQQLKVYDLRGKKLLQTSEGFPLDLSKLQPGTYLLSIKLKNTTIMKTVVKAE